MSLTIGCANQECKQPFSFMLDEYIGGARCPYCGEVSTLVTDNEPRSMVRTSVLVQEPNADNPVPEL